MYMFKCLLRNGENTHVYEGTHFGVDLLLSDSVFFHLFSWSEQHDAMTQILTPRYTSATLQVSYCHLSVMWTQKKDIAVNYLFIQIVQTHNNNKKKKKEKEKKHYHDINIGIREMFFLFCFNLPRPSHFPGMNKVYCYCCFDSISSRTDAF